MRSESSLYNIRTKLGQWFDANARPLPWRDARLLPNHSGAERHPAITPYQVLLSEIILQQTRVEQGRAYYHRFLETFPTIGDLAKASEDEVLRLWQGLGYYSRGRNLLKAAIKVMEDFGGEIPTTPEGLKTLPGVGPYTQGAILSFAYGLPYVAVDGNVYRVLSRLFAEDEPIDTPKGQKLFKSLAEQLLDTQRPSRHNQAVIELGALCCTPKSPNCPNCPIETHCLAHALGRETDFPRKLGKVKVSNRYLYYFLVSIEQPDGTYILIRRRGEGDIWQGLYELPLVETSEMVEGADLLTHPDFLRLSQALEGVNPNPYLALREKHRLTHRLLHVELYPISVTGIHPELLDTYSLIPLEQREGYAFPIVLDKMLRKLEVSLNHIL